MGTQDELSRRDVMRLGAAGALSVGVVGTLAGCGSGSEGTSGSPATGGNAAKKGGTLRWATSGGAAKDTPDPAQTYNIFTRSVNNQIYDTLTRQNENLELSPRLATDWSASSDVKTWTFKLRDDVTFHDGRPLTSKDVAYSFSRLLDEKLAASGFAVLSAVLSPEGIKTPDEHTVELALTEAHAFLPLILASGEFSIVPDGTTDFSKGIGTGPFKLQSFEALANAEMVRNDDHFSPPLLDSIRLVSIAEDSTRIQGVVSGSQDFVDNITGVSITRLTGNAMPLLIKDGAYVNLAAFQDRDPFNKPQVVEAMKYAQDRKKTSSVVAPNAEILLPDIPIVPRDEFYPTGLEPKPYDPERAKSLLAQAGYPDGLTLELYAYEGDKLDTALAYKSGAKAAGITVNIKEWPHSTYWDQVWLKKPFVGDSWGRLHVSDILAQAFHSKGASNECHFNDPQVDQMIDQARGTTDADKQRQLYQDILVTISETASNLIPCCEPQAYGASTKLAGVGLTPGAGTYVDEAHFTS